jgi:hypothetical protein
MGRILGFIDALRKEMPEFSENCENVAHPQLLLAGDVVPDHRTHLAIRLIFGQSVGDLIDLIRDVQAGSGRAASRAARTLVEHAINIRSVAGDLAIAQRYLDHLDQGPLLAEQLEIGFNALHPKTIRSHRHAVRKAAREARPRFEAALANYGSGFANSWNPKNLRERAEDQGQVNFYYYYKQASLIAHGSAAATWRTRTHNKYGPLHTVGLDFESAPEALVVGVLAYYEILDLLAEVGVDADFQSARDPIDAVMENWNEYFYLMRDFKRGADEGFARTIPPSIAAVSRSGAVRWWIESVDRATWDRAADPQLTTADQERLAELVKFVTENQDQLFDEPNEQWVGARFPTVFLTKHPSRKTIQSDAIPLRVSGYDDEFWERLGLGPGP